MSERHWWSIVMSTILAAWALAMHIPAVILILVALMAIDAVLTLLAPSPRRRSRCTIFWMGLMRKTATLLLLAALSASESVLGFDAMDYSAVFFIVHELLSITEKAAALGVPVPVRVRRVLMVLREEYNEQQDRAEDQSNTQNSR